MAELKYADCKMIIERRDKNGKPLSAFTTWREDFILKVLDGASIVNFQIDDEIDITIRKNDVDIEEDGYVYSNKSEVSE